MTIAPTACSKRNRVTYGREKKVVAGYQFMRVERDGDEKVYRIDWKDVVLLLESPIVKTLKIR